MGGYGFSNTSVNFRSWFIYFSFLLKYIAKSHTTKTVNYKSEKARIRERIRQTQDASEGLRAQSKTTMRVWNSAHSLHFLRGTSAHLHRPVSVSKKRKNKEGKKEHEHIKKKYLKIGDDREGENDQDNEDEARRIHFVQVVGLLAC